MKVYKASYNMKCQNLTYDVGKTYSIDKMKMCFYGFHFCENPIDTLYHYDYNKDFTLLECEVLGETEFYDVIGVTNKLKVIRVIPDGESKELLKERIDNYKYDDKGNKIWMKIPDEDIYEYKYDDKGNLIWMKWPNDRIYEYKYDDKGNKIWMKIPNGDIYEWGYKYDDKGIKIWEKDSFGRIYKYKYDDKGNLIWKKNSDGDISEWKYDNNGNRIEEILNGKSQYKITIE